MMQRNGAPTERWRGLIKMFGKIFQKPIDNAYRLCYNTIIDTDNTDRTEDEMRFGGKMNVYEEIVAEIKRMIELGALQAGDKLPSVRQYAVERKVNPNTVAKAYAALEEEGVLRVQLKKGAYVLEKSSQAEMQNNEVEEQITVWKQAGVTAETLSAAIEKIYRQGERV